MKKKTCILLTICLVCLALAGSFAYASFSLGIYRDFAELSENETIDVDYRIINKNNGSDMTVFTIHGGAIAKGTSELATALANRGGFNLYLFEGIKPTDNLTLHLTSTRFDEPTAINMVKNSKDTVSFIGIKEENARITYVGGQNKLLARLVKLHLQAAGFNVQDAPYVPTNIAGVLSSNIVNQNKLLFDTHKIGGVQIAVSKGMRDLLLEDEASFQSYVANIDKALSDSWPLAVNILEARTGNASPNSKAIEKANVNASFNRYNTNNVIKGVLQNNFNSPEELLAKLKEAAGKQNSKF
ncbi:Phage-related replication protein YjqB, UPF0714/DUF867 family [Anaerovirgula multivorans]|uniref:Phage-related replication protein YjqB, UPF0714/DUF867 family n=1 Tax=Anaerovirgula multivorans TaxID=312168 RepID=A0A239FMJ4_9FIRM|nr:poly-gamma-glutamate hydrolase family protein [Anaerovirgula multivorans]SNS57164.1 Phage-related replication protein YjqB, UPF0714/DUF867 family [Anaerovirgula multivorans]